MAVSILSLCPLNRFHTYPRGLYLLSIKRAMSRALQRLTSILCFLVCEIQLQPDLK